MDVVERESGGITVLALAGRMTLGEECQQARARIKNLLADGKGRLVLDLGNVNYIDSAGLGTLVASFTSAQSQGGTLKLARLSPRIQQLLRSTRLLTVFEVFDSAEEAVRSF
jgi:anti-sigma B factor antagonist